MKSKCSFILKASLALVLALVMLFGTVATSVAAVVDDDYADTGADVDIVDEGADVNIADEGADADMAETGATTYYLRGPIASGASWDSGVAFTSLGDNYYYIAVTGNGSFQITEFQTGWSGTRHNAHKDELGDLSNITGGGGDSNMTDPNTGAHYIMFRSTDGYCWPVKNNPSTALYYKQSARVFYGEVGTAHQGQYGRVYFNNTTSNWSCNKVYLVVGHGTYVKAYLMTAESGTKLYSIMLSDNSGFGDAKYYAFVGTNSTGISSTYTSSSQNKTYHEFLRDNRSNITYSSQLFTETSPALNNSSYTYPFTSGSAGDSCSLTGTYSSSTPNTYFNKAQTFTVATYNGSAYVASNTGGSMKYTSKVLNSSSPYAPLTYTDSTDSNAKNPALTSTFKAIAVPATNYEFQGFFSDVNTSTTNLANDTTTTTNDSFSYTVDGTHTYFARFKLKPTVTVSAGTGITVEVADATVASGSSAYVSTSTNTAVTVTADTGYKINSVSGAGFTRTSGETSTTSYTGNINISSNATLTVSYEEITKGVAVNVFSNGELGTSGGNITIGGDTGAASGSNTVTVGVSTTATLVTATPTSGYTFTGWSIEGTNASHIKYSTNNSTWTAGANPKSLGTGTTLYIKTDGNADVSTSTAIVKAHFQKAHYMTVYNNTLWDRAHWVRISSPPQTVKVTSVTGSTTTYTYEVGTNRGEETVKTSTGNYQEGNKLQYYAGDTITMTYSALASSDIISGVFYNNGIRYSTELEPDNKYVSRAANTDDLHAADSTHPYGYYEEGDDDTDYVYTSDASYTEGEGYALFASPGYYNTDRAAIISAQTYAATVNQDTHVVTWTAKDRDYLNIDLEMSSKKEIHFSDYDNTVINQIHDDNYYAIGENLSSGDTAATRLAVYAKGDSNQINTITKANVKLYYCNNLGEYINPATGKKVKKENRVELTGDDATITVNISSGTSIANSGSTNSSEYIYFTGTMPATDVMVDLDLAVSYSIKLYSKILSDTINNKTGFGQVATIGFGDSSYTKNDSYEGTYNIATKTCNDGNTLRLQASSIDSGYMFAGWFLGKSDNSGPDLDDGFLSSEADYYYRPSSGKSVWAVGTKDLYITGNKYLFQDNTDWQVHKMEFDATLGTVGKYYWEITDTIFAGTSPARKYVCKDNGTTFNGSDNSQPTGDSGQGYAKSGGVLYWENNTDSFHGNAYFQFLDSSGSNNSANKTVWGNILSAEHDEVVGSSPKIRYGKVLQRGVSGSNTAGDDRVKNGQGFINFDETTYTGYSTPIRIYYDPAKPNTFTVEPTAIYPHIHLSSGYKNIDTSSPSATYIKDGNTWLANTSSDGTGTNMTFKGAGWNPDREGHVSDILFKQRNAYVNLYKATASSNYKVSAFLVYNMAKKTVKAYAPTSNSGNTYYCENKIKTTDGDRLYIIPIVEYCGSAETITIVVDSTQLNYKTWGDIVACYGWYASSGGDVLGAYPGQPMIPSDDGTSWKITFPKQKLNGTSAQTLAGITFNNYYDYNGDTKYCFLAINGVLGTVSESCATGSGTDDTPRTVSASGGYMTIYNSVEGTKKGNYDAKNFKSQTYDYREPLAYFLNKPEGATNNMLTFAFKGGNGDLVSWTHNDLLDNNILTYKTTHSDWSDLSWEYLTDSSGTKYADLNGSALPDKPTASFYVCAKGMVVYKNNDLTNVYWTGNNRQSKTGSTPDTGKGRYKSPDISYTGYYGESTGEVDMEFGVEWYVYDASGNYIGTALSACFADKAKTSGGGRSDMSFITDMLLKKGYAVEGRSVKICYDQPRFCYTDDGGVPNSGTSFSCYRYTGQWYQDNEYKTAKVYAKVGLVTDNGTTVADASSAAYGSATVSVNSTGLKVSGHDGKDTDDNGVDYGYTAVIDGDKRAITLTASTTNFKGWYHYDTSGKLVQDTDKNNNTLTPSYNGDSTYIALYEAMVNLRYKYTGREGGIKFYNVPTDEHLLSSEIAAGNMVATDSTHQTLAGTNSPGGAGISIFKKNISFNGSPITNMFSADEQCVLTVNNSSQTDPDYTLTYRYRNSSGTWTNASVSKNYNQLVEINTATINSWSGHAFKGWYEYDNSTVGKLLSTQPNYGMMCTKTQTIIAHYEGDDLSGATDPVGGDTWEVFIDDHGPTYEKTSTTTGDVYCDAIVRVRKNNTNVAQLDENARVGYLIVEDKGSDYTIDTSKLASYAAKLSSASGKSGNVSVTVGGVKKTLEVTNIYSTTVNKFGRVDLAAKYSFGNVAGHKYYIYAYYYNGLGASTAANYTFNTTTGYATGTYASLPS